MPDNVTTSLHAQVQRFISGILDTIASEGLIALKQTLDDAGVTKNIDYAVLAHTTGDSVIFEITVDSSTIVSDDPITIAYLQKARLELYKQKMKNVTKTFELGLDGSRRVVYDARKTASDARKHANDIRRPARDARVSARDARRPARDARSGVDRTIENPHGMSMTKDGKLSITIERSVIKNKSEIQIPKGVYQGIIGNFIDRVNNIVAEEFVGELEKIITRYATS